MATEDEDELIGLRHKKGDKFVVHPVFLLPMKWGSPEYQDAVAAQRVG